MELRLLTALGLLVVITVGAVVGVILIAAVVPGGGGAPSVSPDSGTAADAPDVDAPEPGLLIRSFRYAVAFGLGGLVGLFLGLVVGQKSAQSRSAVDPSPTTGQPFPDADGGADADSRASETQTEGSQNASIDHASKQPDPQGSPWESNR